MRGDELRPNVQTRCSSLFFVRFARCAFGWSTIYRITKRARFTPPLWKEGKHEYPRKNVHRAMKIIRDLKHDKENMTEKQSTRITDSSSKLISHDTFHSLHPYQCSKCLEAFRTKRLLIMHIIASHGYWPAELGLVLRPFHLNRLVFLSVGICRQRSQI